MLMNSRNAATTSLPAINQEPHLGTSEIIFSRVLIATDFSKPATQALKLAKVNSQPFAAKLAIVHAATPVAFGIDAGTIPIEVLNANLKPDKEQVNQLVLGEPGLSQLKPHITVAYAETVALIHQVS